MLSATIHHRFSGHGIACKAPASFLHPRTAFDRPDVERCDRPRSPGQGCRASSIPRTADVCAGSGHGLCAIHGRTPGDGHFLSHTGRDAFRSTPRPTGSDSRDDGRGVWVFWAFFTSLRCVGCVFPPGVVGSSQGGIACKTM